MKAIIFPDLELRENNFTYPKEMLALIGLLESEKAKLNIGYMVLEKLWYAFSETRYASFLQVNAETFADFKEWVHDISCEDVERLMRMKVLYNGNLIPVKEILSEGENRYLVAQLCGGVMEDPDMHYRNFQIIRADSEIEAKSKYDEINNCQYYYGNVIRRLKDDE